MIGVPISFFCTCLSFFPTTNYWGDHPLPVAYSLLLFHQPIDHLYMGHFLNPLFHSIDLSVYFYASTHCLSICIIFGSLKSGSEMPPALFVFHFFPLFIFFVYLSLLSPLLLWLFGLSYGFIQILGTLVLLLWKKSLRFW